MRVPLLMFWCLFSGTEGYSQLINDSHRFMQSLNYKSEKNNITNEFYHLPKDFGVGDSDEWNYIDLDSFPENNVETGLEEIWENSSSPTIFIMPGVAQEAYSEDLYKEVFQKGSLMKSRFQAVLDRTSSFDKNVPFYYIAENKDISVSISDLIRVGSWDDGGEVKATFVYLKPIAGSLDTLRPISQQAKYLFQRIEKFNTLMGVPESVYLLGHSKGAAQALELIAQIHMGEVPEPKWYGKLEGAITINGAIWGSAIADLSQQPGNRFFNMIEEGNKLYSLDLSWTFIDNLREVIPILSELLDLVLDNDPSLAPSEAQLDIKALLPVGLSFLAAMVEKDLDEFFASAVRFYEIAMEAVAELSEEARVEWFQNHQLPAHLKYYSLASVFIQQDRDSSNPASLDHFILRALYSDFTGSQGVLNNDGLLALRSMMLHPEDHLALNPSQEPYQSYLLGVMKAHHGTAALGQILKDSSGKGSDFDRERLMHSLVRYIDMSHQ